MEVVDYTADAYPTKKLTSIKGYGTDGDSGGANLDVNGYIVAISAAKNGSYTYSWDNSASTSATATDLSAGLHTITIKDSKDCETTATVTIT